MVNKQELADLETKLRAEYEAKIEQLKLKNIGFRTNSKLNTEKRYIIDNK